VALQVAPPSSERATEFSEIAGEETIVPRRVTPIVDSDAAMPVSVTHAVGRAAGTSAPPGWWASTGTHATRILTVGGGVRPSPAAVRRR
jgi:hypothetical protein